MLKKILFILALIAVLGLVGCKKSSDDTKTMEDYEEEATEQIDEDNMEAELDRLEKSIDTDIEQEL